MDATTTTPQTIFELPFPVYESVRIGDVRVVQLIVPRGTVFNENVFGIGADGRVLWQIPVCTRAYDQPSSRFSGVSAGEEAGTVWAHNWSGVKVLLRATTGEVLSMEFEK